MRRSAQTKVKPPTQSRQYFSGPVDKDGKPIPVVSSNQRLSKNQIITFWAGSLLMLLASFVIGFKAGQKIGAKEVLDQAANQVVRLPIVRPIGRESETVSLAKLEPITQAKEKDSEERKIDFTSQSEASTISKTKTFPINQDLELNQPADREPNNKTKPDDLESKYEVVYPGKNKFGVPTNLKKDEKKEVAAIIIDPVKPPPEKPQFDINSYKPSPGWYVQVTAVPSLPEVESLQGKISSKNLPFKVEAASIRNRPYYRILLGPYPDRAAALDKRLAAKTQAGTPGEPFIRQVK